MSFQKLILAALALALCGIVPASAGTTVYPPTNQAAGGGILYFPQGGNSSLYAVPVISDSLTSAVQAQTEAIEKQTASIDELKEAMKKSSGAIQCSGASYNTPPTCVNTVTGTVCGWSPGAATPRDVGYWHCQSKEKGTFFSISPQ